MHRVKAECEPGGAVQQETAEVNHAG